MTKKQFFPRNVIDSIILTLSQHQQFLHLRSFKIIDTGCTTDLYPFSINAWIRLCCVIRVEVEHMVTKKTERFPNAITTTTTTTTTAVLQLSGFCPRLPEWASTKKNIHPLTPILIINHPLSAFSIYSNPWHPPCSIYVPDSLFAQPLSKSSFVYLLVRHPLLHTSYISSPNHCLLFTAHAHTIATCSSAVLRLCPLIPVSLSTLYLELYHESKYE